MTVTNARDVCPHELARIVVRYTKDTSTKSYRLGVMSFSVLPKFPAYTNIFRYTRVVLHRLLYQLYQLLLKLMRTPTLMQEKLKQYIILRNKNVRVL